MHRCLVSLIVSRQTNSIFLNPTSIDQFEISVRRENSLERIPRVFQRHLSLSFTEVKVKHLKLSLLSMRPISKGNHLCVGRAVFRISKEEEFLIDVSIGQQQQKERKRRLTVEPRVNRRKLVGICLSIIAAAAYSSDVIYLFVSCLADRTREKCETLEKKRQLLVLIRFCKKKRRKRHSGMSKAQMCSSSLFFAG